MITGSHTEAHAAGRVTLTRAMSLRVRLAHTTETILITVEPMWVRRKNNEVAELNFVTAQLRWR